MTHQKTFPALSQTSKQTVPLQAANRRVVNRVTRRLAINLLNNPVTNEVAARAIIMVDARMAQGQLRARDNHRTNVKGKASPEATADLNRQTDEVAGFKGVKANDRMATKVNEAVVLKARRLNSLPTGHFQDYGEGGV